MREAEMKALLRFGTVMVVDAEDRRHIATAEPDRILPAEWVEKWKAQDDGSRKAKSLLVVLGWKDPDVGRLPRSEHTSIVAGIMVSA